ncbi:MAG TPA: ATP-dependent Clp protease proteolytic subunit [Pseudoneobacillus sp.]|nr:ATP-dependent Clp protease proteolytic subunit [Pseudoneobacillus sp.]
MAIIPTVIEQSNHGERAFDIYSRLLRDRIIFIDDEINPRTSSAVVAQLLMLESEDPDKDIYLYINSPGGSITDGMAIHDTMKYIKPDVITISMGLSASMGAFLLASGAKGKRYALSNAEIMIHQPLGGVRGQATDIQITAERIIKVKEKLNRKLSEYTGQPYEKICQDTERDNFMDPEDALKYGIIDGILLSSGQVLTLKENSNSDNK